MNGTTKAFAALALGLAACGVTTLPEDDADAGSTGGSSSQDAASDGAGDAADDAPADCEAVRDDLDRLLDRARRCDPTAAVQQCGAAVQGLCCPVVVAEVSGLATQAYLAAVSEATGLGCDDICAVVDCAPVETGYCQPDPGGGPTGACEDIW